MFSVYIPITNQAISLNPKLIYLSDKGKIGIFVITITVEIITS